MIFAETEAEVNIIYLGTIDLILIEMKVSNCYIIWNC